jgi:phage baseplate assembly protein W
MPLKTREYKDINLSFSPNPVTGDVTKLTDDAAVKRAVKNLILTDYDERFYQPSLGSGIAHLLFDLITQ